jgi:hypothetical protein
MSHIKPELRRRARELVEAGTLPTIEPKAIFGGNGEGRTCSLCGHTVERTDLEFEFELGGSTYRFHLVCHAAWQVECAAA